MNAAQSHRTVFIAHRATPDKQTHKLKPQSCVVWLPEMSGYVSHFTRSAFCSVDTPDNAICTTEELAGHLAMSVRECLGLKATVRPYYAKVGA